MGALHRAGLTCILLKDAGVEVSQVEEVSSREQPPSPWDNLPGPAAPQPDDGRMSFYSAGSLGASGSFANNLGMLSRREDVSKVYQGAALRCCVAQQPGGASRPL